MPSIVPIIETGERKHSFLQPSSAFRWLDCVAAPWEEQEAVKKKPSLADAGVYADEGTDAHSVAEQCLCIMFSEGKEPDEIVSEILDESLRPHIKAYLETVRDTYFEEPETAGIETSVDLSLVVGVKDTWGTVDCYVVSGGELYVFDYKHGQGKIVSAEKNPQMMLYALGILSSPEFVDIQKVHLCIVQPRADNISKWSTTRGELLQWVPDVVLAAARANEIRNDQAAIDEDYAPDVERCRWCKGRDFCQERAKDLSQELDLAIEFPAPALADSETLGRIFNTTPKLNTWLKDIEEEIKDRIFKGKKVPGVKLVAGRQGDRTWKDPAEAEALLKKFKVRQDDMYVRKVISPTQAAKLCKKLIDPENKESTRTVIGKKTQWPQLEELITRKDGGGEFGLSPNLFNTKCFIQTCPTNIVKGESKNNKLV